MGAAVAAVVSGRAEAELIVGMLRSHGIAAQASADDVGGTDPALAAQGVRVLVAPSQAAAARRLMGEEPAPPAHLNAFQRLVVRVLGGTRA